MARHCGLSMSNNAMEVNADLLIVAFYIVNGYTLVTNNKRHFQLLKGLTIEDWVIKP